MTLKYDCQDKIAVKRDLTYGYLKCKPEDEDTDKTSRTRGRMMGVRTKR